MAGSLRGKMATLKDKIIKEIIEKGWYTISFESKDAKSLYKSLKAVEDFFGSRNINFDIHGLPFGRKTIKLEELKELEKGNYYLVAYRKISIEK